MTYKRGFTLIELMVVVVISALLFSGGAVAYNKYYQQERLNQTFGEVLSYLNLSRNMAITNQTTTGFDEGLDYVAVTIENGKISAYPVNKLSGTGPSYFSKNLTLDQVQVSTVGFGDLLFAGTSGKLLEKEAPPSFLVFPVDSNDSVGITVSSVDTDDARHVYINSSGVIRSGSVLK